MKIFIGSDHAGYILKYELIKFLANKYEVLDCGIKSNEKTDYPKIAKLLCNNILKEEQRRLGILLCGTGVGMSIAANKIKGIRAVCCSDVYSAKMSRRHNNTNVLCLGERVLGVEYSKMIVENWINTKFEGERHINRINMIENY